MKLFDKGLLRGNRLNSYNNFTDEELISRLRNGENEIIDYILEKYKPLVRKKTADLFLTGADKDDIIQEGMIGLFKAIRDFKGDKESSFYNFARICIERQVYSAIESYNRKKHQPLNNYISLSNEDRSEGNQFEDIIVADSVSPEQLIIGREEANIAMTKLREELSDMENKVLLLYLQGNEYTEIANILDKSPKSIDNALRRIKQKAGDMHAVFKSW